METDDKRFNQEKLTDLTPYRPISILNVGGGAVGSYLAELQAKMGIGLITVCDIDRYEEDNASKSSSILRLSEEDGETDVGRWKAEALAERVSNMMITGSHSNAIVGSVENLGPLAFAGFDYVCAAPDNKAAREYVNQQLKMLPPDVRPVYVVGGTDGEMATSAIFSNLDVSCYRCGHDEEAFKSSRRRSSCGDAQYRFVNGKKERDGTVSNLSSVKAAVLMAEDLRAGINRKLFVRNRVRVWNPDNPTPLSSFEIERRGNCLDCNKITYPKNLTLLHGNSLTATLREVLEQITSALGSEDYLLRVHFHRFGEDIFSEYVKKDYCRACGNMFDVYQHTRFVESESELLCDACKANGKEPNPDVTMSRAEVVYGFSPLESDDRLLNSTMFELGYPIGAYLWVVDYNGATDLSDTRVRKRCFAMAEDSKVVRIDLNLMEEFVNEE